MNPLKVLKDIVPALKDVLESMHAHLELILEEDKKINQQLALTNERLTEIIDQSQLAQHRDASEAGTSQSARSENDKKQDNKQE